METTWCCWFHSVSSCPSRCLGTWVRSVICTDTWLAASNQEDAHWSYLCFPSALRLPWLHQRPVPPLHGVLLDCGEYDHTLFPHSSHASRFPADEFTSCTLRGFLSVFQKNLEMENKWCQIKFFFFLNHIIWARARTLSKPFIRKVTQCFPALPFRWSSRSTRSRALSQFPTLWMKPCRCWTAPLTPSTPLRTRTHAHQNTSSSTHRYGSVALWVPTGLK